MKYTELNILLPCHSLEDFPVHHEGDDAEGLLANWTAIWHPALIASCGKPPAWERIDDPPEDLSGRLLLSPSVSSGELPTGFAQRAESHGAVLIRNKMDRQEIIAAALEPLEGGDAGIDADLAADFLALGYCYLQVNLLTRQMRYSTNLDEVYFGEQVVAAAQAAAAGDEALAREKLSACFSVLAEERDHYYPVDAFILDLTLVATTTVGVSLRDELTSPKAPLNLLISGEALLEMENSQPGTLSALQAALASQQASLIGGEVVERRLPLLSCESVLGEIQRGQAAYNQVLQLQPKIYGRRRFGLHPMLPQILTGTGFAGALHATLDEGQFPEGSQIKSTWEGSDGASLDAITRAPLDADRPETFLNFAVRMGESMDMDHVATVCVAHWPGKTRTWYEDLRRTFRQCPALGKFVTFDEYISETEDPAHAEPFIAGQYRSPYLKQAVIRRTADPLSSSMRYWQRRAKLEAAGAMNTLAALISGNASDQTDADSMALSIDEQSEGNPLPRKVDGKEVAPPLDEAGNQLDAQLQQYLDSAAERFAACIPRGQGAEEDGCLVLNPCSFVRRVGVDIEGFSGLPATGKPVYAAGESSGRRRAVVDTPPMGFVWLTGNGKPQPNSKTPPLAEENLIRNEFFEAIINPITGTLQSLHGYENRGNRMSQQLAFRLPKSRQQHGDSPAYSVMAADKLEVTSSDSATGEITVEGRLMDLDGSRLAGFKQIYRAQRGSRVLQIDIELDCDIQPRSDPWNSYFAARFAWKDEGADLFHTVHQSRNPLTQRRLESPHYVEVCDEKTRTSILTGGLPFHRREGLRTLDSLLVVRGESQRKFRLGIGVDLPHPMLEAMSLLSPPVLVQQKAAPPTPNTSSWLFHIDARNIVATHWRPLIEDGKVTGFAVRLLETAGRRADVAISTFKDIGSASQVTFAGEVVDECEIASGKCRLSMAAHQWIEVHSRW